MALGLTTKAKGIRMGEEVIEETKEVKKVSSLLGKVKKAKEMRNIEEVEEVEVVKAKPVVKKSAGGKKAETVNKKSAGGKNKIEETEEEEIEESLAEFALRIKEEKKRDFFEKELELKPNKGRRFGYAYSLTYGWTYNREGMRLKDFMELHTVFNNADSSKIKEMLGMSEELINHLAEAYIEFKADSDNAYLYNLGGMIEKFIFLDEKPTEENEKEFIKRVKENQRDYVDVLLDNKGNTKRIYNVEPEDLNPALKVAILSRIVYIGNDIDFSGEFEAAMSNLMFKNDMEVFDKRAINKYSKDKCIYAVGTGDTSLKYDEIDIPRGLAKKLCLTKGQKVTLGRYPKNFVSLLVTVRDTPLESYNGNSLKIHPLTALLLEGDFDGDGYVVTPAYDNCDYITIEEVAAIMNKNLNPAKINCTNGKEERNIVQFMKDWKNFTKEEMEEYISSGGKRIKSKDRYTDAEKARFANFFTKSKTGMLGYLHELGVEKYIANRKELIAKEVIAKEEKREMFEVLYALSRLPDIGVQAKNGSHKDISEQLLMLVARINSKSLEDLFDMNEEQIHDLLDKVEAENKITKPATCISNGKVISSNIF